MEYEMYPDHCKSPKEVKIIIPGEDIDSDQGIQILSSSGFCPIFGKRVSYSLTVQDGQPIAIACLQQYCTFNNTLDN
jgi:hypothetical protein